jgi:hypothetical protein
VELLLDAQGRPDRLTILRSVSGKSVAPDCALAQRSMKLVVRDAVLLPMKASVSAEALRPLPGDEEQASAGCLFAGAGCCTCGGAAATAPSPYRERGRGA